MSIHDDRSVKSAKSCNSLSSLSSNESCFKGKKNSFSNLSDEFMYDENSVILSLNSVRDSTNIFVRYDNESTSSQLLYFLDNERTHNKKIDPSQNNTSGEIIQTGLIEHNKNENNRNNIFREKEFNDKEENICFIKKLCLEKFSIRGRTFSTLLFLGSFLFFAVAICLLGAHFDISERTATWNYVEGNLFYPCSIMVVCGFLTLKLASSRYPNKYLIFIVLLLSLICTGFCIASLVHLIGEVHFNLQRLQNCWFNPIDSSCTCYVKRDSRYKPIRFAKVAACSVVKDELKTLVYGVTVLFGIGFVISITAAATAVFLLCKKYQCNRHGNNDAQPMNSVPTQTEESVFNDGASGDQYITITPSSSCDSSMNSFNMKNYSLSPSLSELQVSSLTLSHERVNLCQPPTYQDAIAAKTLRFT